MSKSSKSKKTKSPKARASDIGGKRLVSLAPTEWVRWVTGDPTAQALESLSNEFQWVARMNDTLIKAQSPTNGVFLVAADLQLRPDVRIHRRLRAYAALAEEKYNLLVYPVVVNILPPPANVVLPTVYDSELMGIKAHQDFRQINLWEIDVDLVFTQNLVALLPFVPVLKGGNNEAVVNRAVVKLKADETLADLEPLLAFFAAFVLDIALVRKIMRWDMAVLRESPWYSEILREGIDLGREEGREEGIHQGQVQMLMHIIEHKFGPLPESSATMINKLGTQHVKELVNVALDAASVTQVYEAVDQILADAPSASDSN